jgi:hypothetical protein
MAALLDNVRILLEKAYIEPEEEDLINLYISRATNFVLSYCNVDETTPSLDEIIEDITVLKYRLKGVEGIKTESKGSLSETYIESLPADIINSLNQHKRLRFQ